MSNPLQSLVDTGTKLYLDSVEPSLVDQNLAWGAVGATSNPAIISSIVKAGGLDATIEKLIADGHDDEAVAWALTDNLVSDAEKKFLPIYEKTSGNAGWVSFELDPLLEDPDLAMTNQQRVDAYIELGKKWASGHPNRMIKVPASEAGLGALEEMAAAGITLNVTLIFTADQYEQARDAIWRGAQRRATAWTLSKASTAFSFRELTSTPKTPPLICPTQHKAGLGRSMQNAFGPTTKSSGLTKT